MSEIPVQIAKFRSLINGYKISQIIMTLEQLEVFTLIGSGKNDLNDIALAIGVRKEKLAPLLNGVVHYGLLIKDGNKYSFSDDSVVLNPNHPASQNGYIRFSENVRDKWSKLNDLVKEDETDQLNKVTGGDSEQTKNFISAMHVNALPQAKFITENYDFSGKRIIDIGAGSGVYSTVVGNHYSDSTGILFDLPGVTPITEDYVNRANLGSRYAVETGDYHNKLPDGQFSDVFLFAVIHQESKVDLDELLKNVRSKLMSGGRMFLTSFFLEKTRTQPAFPTLFSVEMIVMHERGHVYTYSEIEVAMNKAGFTYERVDKVPGPATLYIAS